MLCNPCSLRLSTGISIQSKIAESKMSPPLGDDVLRQTAAPQGGMEGGRDGGRAGGKEGEREGGRKGGREGEGGRERGGGRGGGRGGLSFLLSFINPQFCSLLLYVLLSQDRA
jgi:hypothetical protein